MFLSEAHFKTCSFICLLSYNLNLGDQHRELWGSDAGLKMIQ